MIPDQAEISELNWLVAMPDPAEIVLPNGRILEIRLWSPTIERGEPVRVAIEGFLDWGDSDAVMEE